MLLLFLCFFQGFGDHRDLHVLTHSFPTRRSSDLSVFDHHAAQGTPEALAAFLHEYRIGFPVAIDAHIGADGLPATMRAYAMQGTPTLLLIDRQGRLRLNHFGHLDDMRLGAAITTLIAEGAGQPLPASDAEGPVCRV